MEGEEEMELLVESFLRDGSITKLVPPGCLGVKCVYRTRVISSIALASQILVSKELTVDRLRSIGRVDKKVGRKLPVLLRKLSRLMIERYTVDSPYVIVSSVLTGVDSRVREYIADRFSMVLADPLLYIEDMVNKYPGIISTGWRVVANPMETLDTIMIPKEYLWYSVQYFTSVIATFRPQIVICGDAECYPLPFGIYPSRVLTGLAYDVGDIDGINMLERKYGGANLAVVIGKLDVDAVALAVHPRKYKSRVTFYLKVKNPRDVALNLTRMQVDALKIEEDLLRKVTGASEGEGDLFDTSSIEESIREVLEEELNFD